MRERTEITGNRVLNNPISRRVFNRGAVEVAVGAGLVGAFVISGVVAREVKRHAPESLIGKNIKDTGIGEYLTDPSGDVDQVILRSSPEQGDDQIVGYTKPGFRFWAQPEYGVTYHSDPPELGSFEVGNDRYGHWYRGAGLPVFDEYNMPDGKVTLVPRVDENGNQVKSGTVHVAGNFLVKALEESSK